MRTSCIDCVIKHICQAHILLLESKLGYPNHLYLAIGHLSEAEDEIAEISLDTARDIRDMRKQVEQMENADFPVLDWINKILALEKLPALQGKSDGIVELERSIREFNESVRVKTLKTQTIGNPNVPLTEVNIKPYEEE